jgi:hypothetical protein
VILVFPKIHSIQNASSANRGMKTLPLNVSIRLKNIETRTMMKNYFNKVISASIISHKYINGKVFPYLLAKHSGSFELSFVVKIAGKETFSFSLLFLSPSILIFC